MSPAEAPPRQAASGDVLYFYLSYARLGPLPEDTWSDLAEAESDGGRSTTTSKEDVDPAVEKFFTELSRAIDARSTDFPHGPSGFCDRPGSLVDDPVRAQSEALGRAQVFVPLYSPHYLDTSWTRREQEAFRSRMRQQGLDPQSRVLPVLWTPVPPWTLRDDNDGAAVAQARALTSRVPGYTDNGLRALCLLDRYAAAYRTVLNIIAMRIVDIARGAPVAAASVDLEAVSCTPTNDPSFIVTLVTAEEMATGRSASASVWHPYGGRHRIPAVELAMRTAERLGLFPRIVGFDRIHEFADHNPALVLVDPEILARDGGEDSLHRAFENLPLWVRPVVVGGHNAIQQELARRTRDVLSVSVPSPAETPHRPVELVDGPRAFEATLPSALAKARRTYLQYGTYTHTDTASPAPGPGQTSGTDGALSERDPYDEH